jgi:hypothetical protein
MEPHIPINREKIADFCRRWRIQELSLFGSVLRDDFGPESDVDVMVSFESGHPWTLFDLVEMQEELEKLFGRKVDLVTKDSVQRSDNYIRRAHILSHLEPVYVA